MVRTAARDEPMVADLEMVPVEGDDDETRALVGGGGGGEDTPHGGPPRGKGLSAHEAVGTSSAAVAATGCAGCSSLGFSGFLSAYKSVKQS